MRDETIREAKQKVKEAISLLTDCEAHDFTLIIDPESMYSKLRPISIEGAMIMHKEASKGQGAEGQPRCHFAKGYL